MFMTSYQTERYVINVYTTNKSPLISFETCFIFNSSEILPKTFKIRGNKVFSKTKLEKYESTLLKIECKGKIEMDDLKKHLPTIFDYKIIRKYNSATFIEKHLDDILKLSTPILGKDEALNLIKKKQFIE